MQKLQVIIVGAGPAAFSAATFLARANIKTLVIGNPEQSGLADAAEVRNYPGFPKGVSGRELLAAMQEQAVAQGADFLSGEVVHVERLSNIRHYDISNNVIMSGGGFLVKAADTKEFFADQLLLAHGANFIKTDLPGEKELVGKGINYCALCDGPLYKGKSIVVLGNSNLAAEEALQLVGMGAKVEKIITHAITPNIAPEYQKLLDKNKILVEIGKVEKFAALKEGEPRPVETGRESGVLTVVRQKDGGSIKHTTAGVFIALGVASSSTFAQKLGLEMNGNFLKADTNGRTNVEGVWVAGLARGGVNQVGKSVGEAITAAVDIIKVAQGLPQYLDHA